MSTRHSASRASWRRARCLRSEPRGLRKEYGKVTALNGVDLTIKDGEYLSIVGPSGCGKTTLIKSIAGIIQPDAGEIKIDGNLVLPLSLSRIEASATSSRRSHSSLI